MNPADLTLSVSSPTLASRTLATPQSTVAALKNGRVVVPRVHLEPIYTTLKTALGDQWVGYKAAVNAFVLGNLNQAELSFVLHPLLSAAPWVITAADPARSPVSTLHLHNTLLAALYANILRDLPPSDVALWVVATDKPTASSKNAGAGGTNDKAEERLKRETMALHARDRKRIKSLKEAGNTVNDGLRDLADYRHELAVKAPDSVPLSGGGGLAKTNWDLEFRRRYAQPLAAETLEFPAQSDIQNRIEPICYEAGLAAGAQGSVQAVAEFVELATEFFMKEMLGQFCGHSRSNAEGTVQTARFRRQLHKEEDDVDRGILQRNPAGLLPVESDVRTKREPMHLGDLRIALQLNDSYLCRDQFLGERLWLAQSPDVAPPIEMNGIAPPLLPSKGHLDVEDTMQLDGPEYWKGGYKHDMDELMGILDDCLAVG